ncbi:restriction endonuclease subunit S [Thalassotalea piscium]|uniref:Type I restriction enzyme S subunit n=1 Tax=Thalassotalea piscium TaxID=1230533 RepID=A0A7X0TTL2_9GAMM|nr:restriction endonuclease subunit S [Thalassotalea piscium]MBB6543361.1 type I restriction enzyme S subunit [Thalassotalea piscium]
MASNRHSRAGGNPVSALNTDNLITDNLITDNIDVWTSAIQKRNSQGRGSNSKVELVGIKKLRELILELAVRGKLVPQDPNDEPASVLLEKIAEEKAQLIADKKIKKQKPLPAIADEDKPFELPNGWEWEYLKNIGHDLGQKSPDKEFSYIDVGSINKELGVIDTPNILTADNAPSRARKLVKKGTVIYSTVRPYLLNIAVINDDFSPEPIASTAFAIIHPLPGILASYIYRYLRSPIFISYVESVQTGVAYPAINDKQFFSGMIAIPPLAEQHRIVAKVDELMALCDQLEQQTEQNLTSHQTLVEELLKTLTQSVNADDLTAMDGGNIRSNEDRAGANSFQQSWLRIAEHFDLLFTTEDSIEQLKQTILQLAVMGKLVPQNPSDEPASKLLEKIAEEKAQLIKNKKIKKQKPLPEITDEEKPFELPNGWEWCRLQDSIDVRDGTHDSPKDAISGETYPLVTSKDFNSGDINFESARKISAKDHFEISKRSLVEVDDILFSMIGGNIGNQVIVKDERPFSIKNVALFKYYDKTATEPYYFKIYTENLASVLQDSAVGGAQPFISLGALRKLVFALPPLAEQHRIVAKVDELMALCDQLKTRLANSQTTQLHLADAVVENALTEEVSR